MDHESHGDSLPEKYGQETPPTYSQPHAIHGNAKGGISEGAELYGDLATAESYGYVARGYDAMLLGCTPTTNGGTAA
jgi:hypothetical protein